MISKILFRSVAGFFVIVLILSAQFTPIPGGGGGGGGAVSDVTGTANEITVSPTTGNVVVSIADVLNLGGNTSTIPWKTGTAVPGTCTVGMVFYDTDAAASSQLQVCTATNTWTPVGCALPTWVGEPDNYVLGVISNTLTWIPQSGGSGGGFAHTWVAARCQNTVAASNGSLGDFTSGVEPVAACFTGSNRVGAYLAFSDTNDMPVYDQLELPTGSVPTINADFYVTTSGTSTSDATLRIYTGFSATSLDPAWNSAQNVTFTPAGTANTMVKVTVTGLTTTGSAAGGMMYFKIDRNTADANTEDVRLVNVKFYE
jgi:hypothetical protein